jgi:hypothetical protein
MDELQVVEKILELNGDCFSDTTLTCENCPFKDDCLLRIINLGQKIPHNRRVNWALDYMLEKEIFNNEE